MLSEGKTNNALSTTTVCSAWKSILKLGRARLIFRQHVIANMLNAEANR